MRKIQKHSKNKKNQKYFVAYMGNEIISLCGLRLTHVRPILKLSDSRVMCW
ncbi:hypothetical protein HanRHA438_Chr09g0408011 [Helianthus annuus]|nr:hypothetical protein HanRHA438_Chr09g0408011 [Helianthus annuus]